MNPQYKKGPQRLFIYMRLDGVLKLALALPVYYGAAAGLVLLSIKGFFS